MEAKFNVLLWDFNTDKLITYDVLPYFRNCYKEHLKNSKKKKLQEYWKVPQTFDELKEFIKGKSMHQYWGRCEYEMICHGWPVKKNEYKLDVHEQVMANLDVITDILFKEVET